MAQDPCAVDLTPPVGERDHAQGRDNAPLTLVQDGDYECPYTRKSQPIVHALRQQLGARPRFVYRHFPLTEIYPHALHAAEAAEVADAQGRFWPMHDYLFAHQHELEDGQLADHARAMGLDTAQFAWYVVDGGARPPRPHPGRCGERHHERGAGHPHILH